MNIDIKYLKENNLIIFEGIAGSRAYGTNLPTSDTDIRGVFMAPFEMILAGNVPDQVADKTNDIVYYELGKFLNLVRSNNPNILELINLPKDCILIKDPLFDLVLEQKDNFITKQCRNSFAGYAIQQIKKAKGYNKKINWEESEMVRKTVLDFCYILDSAIGGGSIPWNKWVGYHVDNLTYENFGLANIEHAHNAYAMYRMFDDDYRGIVSDPEKANDVQLVSVPKTRSLVGYLTFNKDAYSLHCKKFKEYNEWLANRNEDRFKMNKDHGKNYDSKNLMHCIRLLDMAAEIANKEIIVRRPQEHIDLLMSIRRGEMELDDLLDMADTKLKLMDEIWDKSTLPKIVDKILIDQLLITIRKHRYELL